MDELRFSLILITWIRLVLSQTTLTVFEALNDNRCFASSSDALATFTPIDLHMCSYFCNKNDSCALISYIRSNNTCFMFTALTVKAYEMATVSMPGTCETWVSSWTPSFEGNSIVFTKNGKFVIPPNITTLKVLAVGGGAGGSDTNGGGGGSGEVQYTLLTVKPAATIDIKIGQGGKVNKDGGKTTLGKDVTANGGKPKTNPGNCHGGSGGSGGGAGCPNASGRSGNGGSDGSNGADGTSTSGNAGTGQGATFTSYFNHFVPNTLSAGQGAAGFTSTATILAGGGGGGGVLLKGDGPNSTNGGCFINGVWSGPGPATGYGAGGSGGCQINNVKYPGGEGADGLVYIEFS